MNKKLIEHGFSGTGNANIFPVNIKDLCYRCLHEKSRLECVEVTIDKHTYSWNFYPLESTKNSVLAWLNDVSEKKKIEETLKSEQSAARRDFYAKMVHELRTPINAIVGFSNILLVGDTQKYTAEELDMLERIYNGGLELSDLISDTLDASKIAAGKMDLSISQFNLSEVLNQLHSQIEGMASIKSLKLIANCSNSLEIRSDKNKVKQILSNLISNAIKYTDEGAITVLVLEPQNRSIEIQISDTGIGLKEDERIKVFENYQRAGEPNLQEIQGTGIGLALVKELVTMLNGEIDVSSTYGKGSTFTVYLPYSID